MHLTETNIINDNKAIQPYPGYTIIQAGNFGDKAVQNLTVERIGDIGPHLVALMQKTRTQAGARKIPGDKKDLHRPHLPAGYWA